MYRRDVATWCTDPYYKGPGIPRNFLRGGWKIDIRSEKGFYKMQEVIGAIMGNTAALR